MTAGGAGDTRAARPAVAAVAEEPRGPAGTTIVPGRTRSAVAAIAHQNPAGLAGLAASRRRAGAVTDERAPQYELGRRVEQTQRVLLEGLQRRRISRLRGGVRTPSPGQLLDELGMEPRRLRTERLVLLGVAGKQRRDRG